MNPTTENSLPLFVQNALHAAGSDVAAVPYIRIFDKQAGEWREIALVCGEGKTQKEVVTVKKHVI